MKRTTDDVHHFQPLRYLEQNDDEIGLILLNQEILLPSSEFNVLWKKAVLKGVADGGINRLHSQFNSSGEVNFVPDYVNGDFDSADSELLDFYKSIGVEIIPTPDQDHTDFQKCLDIMLNKLLTANRDIRAIVILAALGGRFDHEMANINAVLRVETDIPLYIHDKESLVFPLPKGRNQLDLNGSFCSTWCGLIPYGRVVAKTEGLKWNLNGTVIEFGGLVSTSNKVVSNIVSVETDHKLIWTMGWMPKGDGAH